MHWLARRCIPCIKRPCNQCSLHESVFWQKSHAFLLHLLCLQRWAAAGGFREVAKPASLELGSMHRSQVANLLYRFFKWWIAGKAGDTVQGGKRVGACGVCDACLPLYPIPCSTCICACSASACYQQQLLLIITIFC